MTKILSPISRATYLHPKLDPRLAALIELSDAAFGVVENAQQSDVAPGHEAVVRPELRRSGPLAFLKGPVPRKRPVSQRLPEEHITLVSEREEHLLSDDRVGGLEAANGGFASSSAMVPAFITATGAEALDRLGVALRSRAGRMATAMLSVQDIEVLEAHEDVLSVEWTGGARPVESPASSRPSTRRRPSVPPRQAIGIGPSWPHELDGRGCYIGIIDTGGIDLYHPDLVDSSTVSRVAWLWDQAAEGGDCGSQGCTPRQWGYGVEYSREALSLELDPNRPVRYSAVNHQAEKRSHATMVAGVAAGLGCDNEEARGVAPGAEIIYVGSFGSGERALASMIELAEAADYIFKRAEADGRPCVINVSLGDDLGPRDGTSAVELFFDELLATPGRAIVVAAGNSAQKQRHLAGTLGGAARTATLTMAVSRRSEPHIVIEIWCDRGTAPSLQVLMPEGSQTPRFTTSDGAQAFVVKDTHVILSGADPYPNSDNALLRVEIFAAAGRSLLEGEWQIVLQAGEGRTCDWHAWIDHAFVHFGAPEGEQGTPSTITSPGTCRRAITVGAYDGDTRRVAYFSGRGPARGGLQKPDLVACGVDIVAASASTPRRYYPQFSGTSAAAPLVTGAVALLFQKLGPRLTVEEIKQHLLQMADRTGLSAPDPGHGAGRALVAALGSTGEDTGRG